MVRSKKEKYKIRIASGWFYFFSLLLMLFLILFSLILLVILFFRAIAAKHWTISFLSAFDVLISGVEKKQTQIHKSKSQVERSSFCIGFAVVAVDGDDSSSPTFAVLAQNAFPAAKNIPLYHTCMHGECYV